MNQRHLSPRIALICLVTLLGGSTVVHGQLLPLTSTGSLGAWSFPAGYTYKLNTDNLTIDRCAGSVCSWETWNGSTWVPAASGVPVARVVTQAGGPEIAVWDFTTFYLPAGVTLTVEGTRAGAIAATGDVTIEGTVVVTATGGAGGIAPSPVDGTGGVSAQGPGAGGAGLGPGRMVLTSTGLQPLYAAGGGGAGAAGNGLPGSEGNRVLDVYGATWQYAGGVAGGAYITAGSPPLRGGSGGGAGGGWLDSNIPLSLPGGAGGAGGGALMVDAAGSLVISGLVTADGGSGMNESPSESCAGGGGGGSGGYLAFQVDGALLIEGTGRLSAKGGVGGSGTAETEPSYG